MRRPSVLASLVLLVWSADALAQGRAVPRQGPRIVPQPAPPPLVSRRLVLPVAPLVGVPWFGVPSALVLNPPWAMSPWVPQSWTALNPYVVNPWPTYVFIGPVAPNHPQLVFKDGATYTVRDYWQVDDQLHFITIEDDGSRSVEHIVPLGDLDRDRTAEADATRGFRFVLRNEPIEQWLRDHASAR